MLRKCALTALIFSIASMGWADPIRTVTTKENRFPELWRTGPIDYHFEGGAHFLMNTYDADGDTERITPYVRLRPLEDLVVFGEYPFVNLDLDANSDSGLGDIKVGAELRVFNDLFNYPWVMLHGDFTLDSATDDLGLGENSFMVGLAMGTVTYNKYSWTGDLRYRLRDKGEDIFSGAVSLVYDVSDTFAWIGEIEYSDFSETGNGDGTISALGGLSYEPNDSLSMIFHAGSAENSDKEFIASVKVALDL